VDASGCAPRIPVMKTAEAGLRDDLTHLGRLNRPVIRSVLLEGEMKAVLVVPDLKLAKQPPRVTLIRHNHVVEQFAADGPRSARGTARPSVRLRRSRA